MIHEHPAGPSLIAGLVIALVGMGAIVLADRCRLAWLRGNPAVAATFPLAGILRRQWLPDIV